MPSSNFRRTTLSLVLSFITFHAMQSLAANPDRLILSFDGYAGGCSPIDRAIFDDKGNLYGVTQSGGAYNAGIAFELTPGSKGTWTEMVLHNFGAADDGVYPSGQLVFDSSTGRFRWVESSSTRRRTSMV
ncbi:MAG: hypothetical protein WAL56_20370 [Candidatus Sulfotelmatobacter sp.]